MTSLASTTNHQIRLARRPVGLPVRADWSFTAEPLAPPEPGGVVVKTLLLSLDPAMRGWMNEGKSYIAPVAIDAVMRAAGIGVVVASESAKFAIGDHVSGVLGVQEYASFDERQLGRGELVKIDLRVAPATQWLNVLGMPGMTGYFGLMDVGQPQPGETVVVSGAAGAVGQTVGQVAKHRGCRVVGIAGGADKCRYLVDELGFDAAVDYRQGEVYPRLKEHCPKGIDVYFDNVGGEILDVALAQLAPKARVVICGAISQYNSTSGVQGPKNYLSLLINRARMEGFVVSDYIPRWGEAVQKMATWMGEGKLKAREDIVAGLETFPEALAKLFTGENFGKLVLKVGA